MEIGCGIGTDAVGFALAGAKYTGIDVSANSIAIAAERFSAKRLKGRFVVGNAEDLRRLIAPEKFDMIYCFGMLHHTPRPQRVVNAVMDYMGSNSEFRLMLYARDSWKDIMIEAGLDQPEAQVGCPIAKTYTREEARSLLRRYHIIAMEQTHIFPYVVEDYRRYVYTVQPWFKSMPKAMFKALERRLGWHLLIRASKREI